MTTVPQHSCEPSVANSSPCNRRQFLGTALVTSLAFTMTGRAAETLGTLPQALKIGLIADLHHDVMHDGLERMQAFVDAMQMVQPAAVLQLGDFAYPNPKNSKVIDLFNQSHEQSLHVIGNHDTDAGHTKQQCLERWGMTGRYYVHHIGGLNLVVLDGNDPGSLKRKGGYASYVGPEQIKWLKKTLEELAGPIIVVSHQPLAGAFGIDNAEEVQAILASAADKILLAINGHTHIDQQVQVQNVNYLHINSASYYWVGSKFKHDSFSADVHKAYPYISSTCPYKNSLFAVLKIDPKTLTVSLEGKETQWVGKSPAELKVELQDGLQAGAEIVPQIRQHEVVRKEG